MTDDANQEWISIKLVEDEEEAELIEGFLRSQGIPCQLDSRYSHEFPSHVGQLGEIEVKVPPDQADEARALLDSRDAPDDGGDGPDEDDEPDEADAEP